MIEAFKLLGEISLKGGEAVQSQLETISGRAEKAGGGFKLMGLALKGTAIAIGAVVTGAVTLGGVIGKSGLEYNSMIENSTVAWTTLLGSQEKAKQQIQDIANFAAKTQFGTEQVDKMAKYFFNAGIQGKDLMVQLTRIADISGAFNIPAESAGELARQMAQVDQAGVAYTEDLNILQDRGVPIYKAIAKELGINVAQVKKMASQGKLTADIYNTAFNSIADSVKGSADKQSNTMTGLISTFQDMFGMLSGTLTQGLFNSLEGGMHLINDAMSKMQEGFKKGGFKGMLEAIMPKATADSIVNTINTIKNAISVLFAFLSGDNIKAINILTAMGLSPAMVVGITTTFVKIRDTVVTYFGMIVAYWQNAGTSMQGSGFIKLMQSLWNIVQPVLMMVWGTIQQVLGQIQQFWAQNGTQIMQAVQNFWTFISAVFNFFAPLLLFIIKMVWDSIAGVISGAISIIEGIIQVFTAIFTGNWSMLWQGLWNILKGAVELIWNFLNLMFMASGLGMLKGFALKGLEIIKVGWRGIVDAIVGAGKSIIENVVSWVNKIIDRWNMMKTFGESLWSTIKNTIVNIVVDIKNVVVSHFQSLVDGARSKFDAIKSTATSIFNAVKNAITNPIETAKNMIGGAVDWIRSKFAGLHISLPNIKVPSFRVVNWSNNPADWIKNFPSVKVSWNAEGGLVNRATLIGAGEAGNEAILPLEGKHMQPMAKAIAEYLGKRDVNKQTPTEVPIMINGRELARAIIVDIDQEMERRAVIRRRGV